MTDDTIKSELEKYLLNINSMLEEDKSDREKSLTQDPITLKLHKQHYEIRLYLTLEEINKIIPILESLNLDLLT